MMVSVVMPNYNGGKFIADSINSVLNQTFSNIELIIVDDNSTDNSLKIIQTFNEKRIKIICLSVNKGVSNARNIGINHSKGKFISFIAFSSLSDP